MQSDQTEPNQTRSIQEAIHKHLRKFEKKDCYVRNGFGTEEQKINQQIPTLHLKVLIWADVSIFKLCCDREENMFI